MSAVRRMDHFTIVTNDLEAMKEFYAELGRHPSPGRISASAGGGSLRLTGRRSFT